MHVLQIPFNQNANDAELTSISNWARDILMMSAVVVVCSIFTDTVLWEELNLLLWIRRVSFELASTCVKKRKELEWIRKKEGAPGFEPGTSRSAVECSTTELYPQLRFRCCKLVYSWKFHSTVVRLQDYINCPSVHSSLHHNIEQENVY